MPAEWQFLLALNDRLRPLKDPAEIQEVAAHLIGEHLQVSRVNYAQIEGNEFVVSRSYARGVPPFTGRRPLAAYGNLIIDSYRRGDTVVIENAETDSRLDAAGHSRLAAHQIAAVVGVPLTKQGGWVGTFSVHSQTPRAWTREQIALVEVAAELTWGARERARAEEALRRTSDRRAFLRRLSAAIAPVADPSRVLDETCRLLGTHLAVNRVAYGEIAGELCTTLGQYVDGIPPQPSQFRWTQHGASRLDEILQGETMVVNDTTASGHTDAEREALREGGCCAYICPLLVKDGRFVAAFAVHSREPRVWTPDEIVLVDEVADRTWATLERLKAEEQLRAKEGRLAFILQLNDALRPLNDPGEVQETAARMVGDHIGANRVGYAEFVGNDYAIRREYARGVPPLIGDLPGITLGPELRAAMLRGETAVVNDMETDPRLDEASRATLRVRQIAALIGTTLFKDGRMVASFGANHATRRVWTSAEIELVRDVGERTWDAVARTRAQAALREQEQRLRLALEASAGGSWTWDAATGRVHWDERFRALYGFSVDQPATTDGWMPRVHEEDRPRLLASLTDILTSKTAASWENTFRIVRPDGTAGWIQSRGRVDRDADGNVTRLSGLDLDFSQHRLAEEALEARREEERDRALRTLLETAGQGIVSVDARGIILTANRAFEEMFGWPHAELVGASIEPLMPSAFRGPHDRRGAVCLTGVRKDGIAFPIEVSLNHVPTPAGDRAFAFVTDITERQATASALQEHSAELEYRTRQLSRMASELTLAEQHAREQIAKTLHDGLQQLLVIAALNLEQHLKRDYNGGTTSGELVSEAKRQIEQAMAAARSLNVELYPPVLQQSGLPAALTWLANWTHDKYKLDVRVKVDPRADSGRKDVRTLLFESARELLFNAVKHAGAEQVSLDLTLDAADSLCITVSDSGVGFEPSELEQRSKDGEAGWGLFSIRERITLLGGRYDIESARGKGTRVRLVAPRGEARHTAEADVPFIAASVASAGGNARAMEDALRILIVDDHSAVRTALRDILHERPQFSVVGDAANGFEAITHAHMLRPDVILMDVAMPHMDGIDATARIRAQLPEIQILGLSMHPRSAAAHAIEQAGASGFFVKGVDTQRLIEHLLVVHGARTRRLPAN